MGAQNSQFMKVHKAHFEIVIAKIESEHPIFKFVSTKQICMPALLTRQYCSAVVAYMAKTER